MTRTFLYADPHFGHQGVCEFVRADGSKLRPWDTFEEMNSELQQRYCALVKSKDKVYFLGDVAMKPAALKILDTMPGDKVLIKGNHDQAELKIYQRYFRDVRAYWQLGKCLLSHIPIHPQSMGRWRANIHGHLHANQIEDRALDHEQGIEYAVPDPRYLCVSVEHTDFEPILLEDALARIESRQGR